MTTDTEIEAQDMDHTPMQPVRKGIVGEVVFGEAWQKLMATTPEGDEGHPLYEVLQPFGYKIHPKDAKVLASVVVWFGTNCGKTFLEDANAMTGNERYLKAWAVHNRAVRWTSNGRRVLESLLFGEKLSAKITVRQLDAVDCLMVWLGTSPAATAFMAACEDRLEKLKKEEMLTHFLSANCNLNADQLAQAMTLARGMAGA